MPEHPNDQVVRAKAALEALDALLCLAQDSPNGLPGPAAIAAIITPVAALLGQALETLEAEDARRHHRQPRLVV